MNKAIPPKDEINVGAGGEWHQVAGGEHPPLTTNQGLVIADNKNSLKANQVIVPKVGIARLADGKLQVVDSSWRVRRR